MQRKVCVVMMDSVAETPWLNGKIRVARECAWAPELIIGVPLHNGQWALRRLKKEISQVSALKAMPPIKTLRESMLGSVKMSTSEVSVVTIPT